MGRIVLEHVSKEFPGGVLILTGANSAVGLRSLPAKYVLCDEPDGWPLDAEVPLPQARSGVDVDLTAHAQHGKPVSFLDVQAELHAVPPRSCSPATLASGRRYSGSPSVRTWSAEVTAVPRGARRPARRRGGGGCRRTAGRDRWSGKSCNRRYLLRDLPGRKSRAGLGQRRS